MATPFEVNSNNFGTPSTEENYNKTILEPVQLSNSTRRMMKPTELENERVSYNSFASRLAREDEQEMLKRQSDLMDLDRMEDEAYDRKIEQRAKAAAWNDKVKAQEQGLAVADELGTLDPTQPDYESKVADLTIRFPLAQFDARVKSVLDAKKSVFETTKAERTKAEEFRVKQEDRAAAREDNQEFQLNSARIARESNQQYDIEKEVSKLDIKAQDAYRNAVASGKTRTDALGLARDEDSKVISKSEYDSSRGTVRDLRRSISQIQTALSETPDALSASSPEFMEKFNARKQELEDDLDFYRSERDRITSQILRPYEDSISVGKPEATKGQATQTTSGTTETEPLQPPGALSPDAGTVSVAEARKKTGNQNLQVGEVLQIPVKRKDGTQTTKQFIITN